MGQESHLRGRAESAKQSAKAAANQATVSPLMETMLRLGYLVRGAVYGVIGLLALEVAIGGGGKITDPQGAISQLGQTTLGDILLYVILIGLVGYGLWGLIRGIVDPQHRGTKPKGIVMRVGYAISGISYILLGAATLNLIEKGSTGNGQTAQLQKTIATILTQSWGQIVVALIGLIVIGIGFAQIYQGINPTFERQFRPYALNPARRGRIVRFGRVGMPARGIVFTLIGLFLFLAAVNHNPGQAQGIDGVLSSLLQQPSGPYLLAIVAVGLLFFGFFSAMCGIWLRARR
jgi:hypothetical protein